MKQEARVFDDTYTGPRWRYGLALRPISAHGPGSTIDDFIIYSHRPSTDPRCPHGEVDYPREIPEEIARRLNLVPLGRVAP